MNKLAAEAKDFCQLFLQSFKPSSSKAGSLKDVGIAPTIASFQTVSDELLQAKGILLGVQNVHWEESGAHTGELSPPMVRDLGAEFAIVGHSERRQFYGETDESVAKRAQAAVGASMLAVVCVGESQKQYEAGETKIVVSKQLEAACRYLKSPKNLVIAYEPIWAIGTGLASTPENAEGVHTFIREKLAEIFDAESTKETKILYGGSTKPGNVAELMARPNIDGALVGGASLEAKSFLELIEAGRGALAGKS